MQNKMTQKEWEKNWKIDRYNDLETADRKVSMTKVTGRINTMEKEFMVLFS